MIKLTKRCMCYCSFYESSHGALMVDQPGHDWLDRVRLEETIQLHQEP